ncbi:hypothetical protein M8009_18305 [Halomonas sp. ATCH28]|uniref:Bacteriophage lambda head decoration protein D n=1 Tax=Halomonas gemina TaxID=2945105 RepID=A0ABT0T5N1_9GAMM|nr:hypothetical protein [Halomonas gemina]MCL7942235.1 hypothetical protein [Halomonas gemina]
MKVATVKARQGSTFLVHTTDLDVNLDAVAVNVAGEAGDILESAGVKVSGTSTGVIGILAEDTDGTGSPVRVMTRGTPSTVDRQKLNYNDAVQADIDAMLEAKGIVVINNK